ncbi:MAG: carboxypeptidase regulatory-like domain-containing protein [Pyrinomonadaceae bacterium]
MNAPRPHRVKSFVETFVKTSSVKTSAALLLLLLLAAHATRAQTPQKAQATPAAATPTPQTQPTPRPASTVLAGRVLGETGEPVPDATVSLSPRTPGMRPRGASYTLGVDEGGNFRFEGLDPGLYDVYGSLPGFVSETDSLSGRSLGPYRPGDNVTVRLVKGGVVTGTVTDSQGQPLATIGVRAMRVRDLDGAQTVLANYRLEGHTDDRGVYRLYGLRPGLYVVYAGGHISYPFPFFAGYGEVASFYPSGSRDTAAEITVRSGQEVGGIDIRLRDDPARRVTGTVELSPGALVENSVTINLAYASTGMIAGTAFDNPNSTSGRSFFFDGVADGEYDLQALVNNRDGVTFASAPQRVSVRGADVTGLRLTVVPLASASGTLRFEPSAEAGRPAPESCKGVRASQLPQETLITAAAASGPRPTAGRVFSRLAVPRSAPPDSTGAFTVRGLEAGRYRLSARLFDEALYVRAVQTPAPAPATTPQRGAQRAQATTATNGSRDLFDLKAGQQLSGLTVRVAEGAASFAGSLTAAEPSAGETPAAPPPFSQLRVHLVPQERERAEDTLRYYEAPVSGDGTFAFKNLAPGRYLVVTRPFFAEAGERDPSPAALDAGTRAALRREAESANTTVELQPCQRKTDFVLRFPPPTK